MIFGWIRIPCSQAHRLLSERMERPIKPSDNWRLRLHLAICDMCSRFGQQIELMRAAVRRIGR
ncbi:MAG TPA: zf-HC2 domain-containing protein [Burkholderiaceae bacterium]|nr:zf-HC2 domain-containing protein [Burkholderiaceae bacterium]